MVCRKRCFIPVGNHHHLPTHWRLILMGEGHLSSSFLENYLPHESGVQNRPSVNSVWKFHISPAFLEIRSNMCTLYLLSILHMQDLVISLFMLLDCSLTRDIVTSFTSQVGGLWLTGRSTCLLWVHYTLPRCTLIGRFYGETPLWIPAVWDQLSSLYAWSS